MTAKFRRITPGHYLHTSTGVEIVKRATSESGARAGGWYIYTPDLHAPSGRVVLDIRQTLADAKAAHVVVNEIASAEAQIAAAYDQAWAEFSAHLIDQAAAILDDGDRNPGHRLPDDVASALITARLAWKRGDYPRARAWAATAADWALEVRAEQVERDHAAAIRADRDMLARQYYAYAGYQGGLSRAEVNAGYADWDGGTADAPDVHEAYVYADKQIAGDERYAQFEPFAARIRAYRDATGAGLREGMQAILAEDHADANLINAYADRVGMAVSSQNYDIGLAVTKAALDQDHAKALGEDAERSLRRAVAEGRAGWAAAVRMIGYRQALDNDHVQALFEASHRLAAAYRAQARAADAEAGVVGVTGGFPLGNRDRDGDGVDYTRPADAHQP